MKKYWVSGIGAVVMTALTLTAVLASATSRAAEVTAKERTPVKVATAKESAAIERGRYLVRLGGCNDCHTPGFTQANGVMDEHHWLTGDSIGWQGPWGTTFPINLRLFVSALTEDQWVTATRASKARPPMPVWVFRDLTDQDLRSMYRFIRSLGPTGEPAPAYLPPGTTTKLPAVKFPG